MTAFAATATTTGQEAMRRLTTATKSDLYILLPRAVHRRVARKYTLTSFVEGAANVSSYIQ
jgi:hypothetical protein